MIAEVLNINVVRGADNKREDMTRIKRILKTWIKNGVLKTESREDKNRHKREFLVQGSWSDSETSEQDPEEIAMSEDRNNMVRVPDHFVEFLPWSSNEFTPDYLREWLASREEAGRKIDIETCEIGCWYTCLADPYGLHPDVPEEFQQIGRMHFVRSAESHGWISRRDLPPAKRKAMDDRIERERKVRQPL
jgi:hypothetical protein